MYARKTIALLLSIGLLACAGAAQAAPTKSTQAGRYLLVTIKGEDGKEMLVRIDKETGATWVMRYGDYPPSSKGPVHYWLSVPWARGDTLLKC